MWIDNDELDLLDLIFETEDKVPRNKKGGLKLRHISFFTTNTKAIINVCKNLERHAMHEALAHQYIEVLRKMGLVNKSERITKYGEMLLKIMYHDNNRIIDELTQPNVNIENVSDDIPFIIEFFLFAVVKKCLDSQDECRTCGIVSGDLAAEPIDSLKYFFSNIIDTLREPTNKNYNLNKLFSFDNKEFYYTIQGMNFSGYEIKRLLRLEPDNMDKAWKTYLRILNEAKTVDITSLTQREKRYYEYSTYYINLVQKDVRNRVKHSILNYILLDSIHIQRNKMKIVHKPEYDAILPYTFIETVFDKYKLRDVYNLVYFEKDSKYITNQIKPMKVSDTIINNIDITNSFDIEEAMLRNQHVNIGDNVMFSDEHHNKILKSYVYKILEMKKNGINVNVAIEKREEMNPKMENVILDKFKEEE